MDEAQDRPNPQQTGPSGMMNDPAKMAWMLGGGSVAALGLRRGGILGLGLAAVGGYLAWQAATGKMGRMSSNGMPVMKTKPVTIRKSLIIHRPPDEIWSFWRQQENLSRFMSHVERIDRLSDTRYHWVVRGPMGTTLEWDAELEASADKDRLAWKSLPHADIRNEGEVRFVETGGGLATEVHVTLTYDAPGGEVGRLLAKALGEEPGQQAEEDLRSLKQILEVEGPASGGLNPERLP